MTVGESPGTPSQNAASAAIRALVSGADIEVIPLRDIDQKLQAVAPGLLRRMGDAIIAPDFGVERLHLFSFNQVAATVQWQGTVGSPMAASA